MEKQKRNRKLNKKDIMRVVCMLLAILMVLPLIINAVAIIM